MTPDEGIRSIVEALSLPADSRVDMRVPKKLLLEQGAPTAADKRAIQAGIDELHWLASCKPNTIGVAAYADENREYLEIAVVGCAFRLGAKSARLIELIHRAIPYPVLLIAVDGDGLSFSVAHKRNAQNEAGKVVIEGVVSVSGLALSDPSGIERDFMRSLALAEQPKADLFELYAGWLARIEALRAGRQIGAFPDPNDAQKIEQRRAALQANEGFSREIALLRAQASRAKQLRQKVDLNQKIKAIEQAIANNIKLM